MTWDALNTWPGEHLLATINLLLCIGICGSCICRLNSHTCTHHRLARARYTLLLAGAMASGLQPLLFGSWPSLASVVFAASVLCGLLINIARWSPRLAALLRHYKEGHDA